MVGVLPGGRAVVHSAEYAAILRRRNIARQLPIAEAFALRLPRRTTGLRRGPRKVLPDITLVLRAEGRPRIGYARAVYRVVRPYRGSAQARRADAVEIIPVDEGVVHNDGACAPPRVPAPSTPTVPAGAEEEAYIDGPSESEVEPRGNNAARRPIPARVGIPERRSPDPGRIIHRHVDYVGAGRLYGDVWPAVIGGGLHLLLWGGLQLPGLLCLLPHALHRIHYILLLRQKRVAQVRGPGDVVVQALQHIREDRQGLDAGIPILLLRGLGEGGTGEPGIPLQPLEGLHHFQRIRGGHQKLAQQRIGI